MTLQSKTSLIAGALLCAVLWPRPMFAQQTSAARAVPPVTPATHAARATPQGFSVVLVVGDLQASAGDDDVPPAARRALADMKDFLPYKSYKLVDAAWIVGTSHAVSRLRGPEDRDYELEITTTDPRIGRITSTGQSAAAATPGDRRVSVMFSLRDAGSANQSTDAAGSAGDASLASLRRQLGTLQNDYTDARAKYSGPHPEVQRLAHEIEAVQAKIEAQERQVERRVAAQARAGNRPVINTSFSMDVGETVVVGTSRLSGNSKALIALLTAVPQKSSAR